MATWIKLQGENIIAHEHELNTGINTANYDAKVQVDFLIKLDNDNWYYKYKYSNGQLVELSDAEMKAQPQVVKNRREKKMDKYRNLVVERLGWNELLKEAGLSTAETNYINKQLTDIADKLTKL